MNKHLKKYGAITVLAAILSACGGGGGGGSINGGANSSLLSNEVSVSSSSLTAGRSAALTAHAIIRGAAPTAMTWSVTSLGATNANDPMPIVSDATCAGATYVPPVVQGTAGEGICNTMLTIPPLAKAGTWRIMNTATSATNGAVGNYVDVTVTALPVSGFQLVMNSTAINANVNQPTTLNIPFTVNPGAVVTNVKYQWTADTANPSTIAIAGATNSSASVTPLAVGQYNFNLSVSADINGFPQTATGSVVLNATKSNQPDILDAGLVQVATSGAVVQLVGNVLNRDAAMTYVESWSQLPAAAGGPVLVTLSNAGSATSSFVAPATPGSYGFEYKVIKTLPDGSQMVSAARTTVVVQATASTLFTVSAGNISTIQTGTPATLTGSVGTQGAATGIAYTYAWTQIGVTPAVVTVANANTLTPSFIPTVDGTYTFDLAVTASGAGTSTTVVGRTQVVASSAPTAGTGGFTVSAGNVSTSIIGSPAVLSGSVAQTGGAAGSTFTYAWTQIGITPAVDVLSNANTLNASFVPSAAGTYTFLLSVTKNNAGVLTTQTAQTQVVVSSGTATTALFAITANAGAAQIVAPNTVVTLTGAQTTQGTAVGVTYTYAWAPSATNPAVVTLSNAASLTPTFLPTISGTYGFTLTVTATLPDATTRTAVSTTQVLIGNAGSTFTVSAGDAQVVTVNTATLLTGAVTTQGTLTGTTFTYAWTQIGLTPAVVSIANSTSLAASFLPTLAGPYTFQLIVTATQGSVVTTQTSQTQVLVN